MGAEARNSYNFWQSHKSERLAKRKFQAKEKYKRPSVLKGFANLPGHRVGASVKKHFIAISRLKRKASEHIQFP